MTQVSELLDDEARDLFERVKQGEVITGRSLTALPRTELLPEEELIAAVVRANLPKPKQHRTPEQKARANARRRERDAEAREMEAARIVGQFIWAYGRSVLTPLWSQMPRFPLPPMP